jgi:hypothetical protein
LAKINAKIASWKTSKKPKIKDENPDSTIPRQKIQNPTPNLHPWKAPKTNPKQFEVLIPHVRRFSI